METRNPIIDLHGHFPMQLPIPVRPCDNKEQTKRNQALMDAANRFANFQFPFLPFPVPRYQPSDANNAGVNFGSVLYQAADEVFGPCGGFQNLSKQITEVNSALAAHGYHLAKNPAELKDLITSGTPAAFHCLEGGFSIEDPANVQELADEGLAYVILAHLVFRGISASVNAFPFMSDGEYERMFAMPVAGLTELGRSICIELCSHGIIPDVTHATEEAIKEVFAIADANKPKRPVIVSHGAPRGDNIIEYKLNLSRATIKGIRDREGVIGVIFYDHWLLPPGSPKEAHGDIGTVVDAIQRISEIAGTTTCIAIGSDLDGFIHPVDGLENVGKFRALEKELLKRFSASEVRGILCDNALATFSKGWGKSSGHR